MSQFETRLNVTLGLLRRLAGPSRLALKWVKWHDKLPPYKTRKTDRMVSVEGCCMLRSNKKWESYIFGLIKKLSFYCNLFWGMVMPCKRQELLPTRFNVKTTVHIWTVRFQHLLSTLLNQLKLVYGPFGQSNMHSTLNFCPKATMKEINVPLYKRS